MNHLINTLACDPQHLGNLCHAYEIKRHLPRLEDLTIGKQPSKLLSTDNSGPGSAPTPRGLAET